MAKPKPSSSLPPRSDLRSELHPRNRHRARYDFVRLTQVSPELAAHVRPNPYGDASIDYADPTAVIALNRALLKEHYGVAQWDLPSGYLCPPIPGRVDYLHHLADLLAERNGGAIPRGPSVVILDIGVGANCIYPLLGASEFGWRFVAADIDSAALQWARQLVAANPGMSERIECRLQPAPEKIFSGVIRPGEGFAAAMCNPPFHASAAEASAGTRRKVRNLGGNTRGAPVLNFGGRATELWCPGGEAAFVERIIAESAAIPASCQWFTSLVSNAEHLPRMERALRRAGTSEVRIIPMAQGQKKSRIVAWRFTPSKT